MTEPAPAEARRQAGVTMFALAGLIGDRQIVGGCRGLLWMVGGHCQLVRPTPADGIAKDRDPVCYDQPGDPRRYSGYRP
jgi:hypothetical protein